MQSLYGRLFKYRERPERRPLEDYLSECLADFLNRLSKHEQVHLIERLFVPAALGNEFRLLAETAIRISVETQRYTDAGRLDLVILFDHEPVIAIESKTGSPVGERRDGTDQLSAYGLWLRRQADAAGRKMAILCFLTHLTKPPDKFTATASDVYGATPHVLRWSKIAMALRTFAEDEASAADRHTLARELYAFLTEHGMTSESPRLEDFAAAIVYVRSGSRLSNAFQQIYDHLLEKGGIFSRSVVADQKLSFDSKASLIQGWKYLSAAPLKAAYFSYGIVLQPKLNLQPDGDSDNEHLPTEDSLFLSLGTENRREMRLLEEHSAKAGPSWRHFSLRGDAIIATFRPFKSVLIEPESFSTIMKDWIDQSLPDLMPLLESIKETIERVAIPPQA